MAAVVVVTSAATWWVWPRPALALRVELGGRAVVVDRWGGTSALPETLHIASQGRGTRVRIENRDTTYQTLGIFGVAANSERSFSVPLPGAYGGYCSAHASSGRITYLVE
ncbi:MAG TPA: hypothetical protein VE861_05455 [Gemmatimonadaceae bacterium]|nr:hypothetical protein [Gemmatimonadaceae bacterium]